MPVILTLLVFLLLAQPAEAFRVSPMQLDLEQGSGKPSSTIVIENTDDKPIAVEIRVEHRRINPDGSEERTPVDDDFLIFPPLATVPPQRTQAVRVQYLGEQPLDKSASYIVFVKQLPVDFSEENTGVQFAFEFGVSVQVVPANAQAAIAATVQETGAQGVVLSVANTGTKYSRLTLGRWELTLDNGETVTLESDVLREAIAQPLIQPDTTRTITLPLPEAVKGRTVTAARFIAS